MSLVVFPLSHFILSGSPPPSERVPSECDGRRTGLDSPELVSADRPLRVTLVTNQVDKVGGLERYVDELASGLVARSFDVTIVAKRTTPGPRDIERREDGVTIVRTRVPSKEKMWFAVAYGVGVPIAAQRELAELPRADVLHGHFFVPMLGPALFQRNYIYTFHGPVHQELLDERQDSYDLPGWSQRAAVEMTRRAENRVLSNADLVTVLSEFMKSTVREMGASPKRVTVLPGGVDTSTFSPGRSERPASAGEGSPLLLVARRLAAGKGVLELVRAMPTVIQTHPNAKLIIAGSGALEQVIEDAVGALDLRDSVTLVGNVTGRVLVNWIRCADLCVVPTQRPEPFGLSTVEALACGTPVCATPSGANVELLGPLDRSLILPGHSPEAMGRGITTVLGDEALLARMRDEARGYVHPRFSWRQVVDRWADIYRSYAEERTAKSSDPAVQ
jgi:glycosyltransferase involved in cell wall biosynthesis